MTLPDEKSNYIHRIGRVGRAERMGLAVSLVATVQEKIWYHGEWCPSRGKNCSNTRTTKEGGCCVWNNEMQASDFLLIRIFLSSILNGWFFYFHHYFLLAHQLQRHVLASYCFKYVVIIVCCFDHITTHLYDLVFISISFFFFFSVWPILKNTWGLWLAKVATISKSQLTNSTAKLFMVKSANRLVISKQILCSQFIFLYRFEHIYIYWLIWRSLYVFINNT